MTTIDDRYFELMPTLVVWNRYLGEDAWGNDAFAADVAMRVRVEPVTVTLNVATTQAGAVMAELGQSVKIIADLTSPRISPLDHITIVEEDQVLVVESQVLQYDEHGPYYQEAQCKNSEEPLS